MMAQSGVPVVLPSKNPLNISGSSASFLGVDKLFLPGALLFISADTLSKSISKPGSSPSILIPMAFPCDSPNMDILILFPHIPLTCYTS